jgi:hypothetical protein
MALTESMSLQGLPTGAFGPATTGTVELTIGMTMQLKPTLLADIRLHMDLGSRTLDIGEILTSAALYLDVPGSTTGKPWTMISLADLPHGVSLSSLFEQLQEGDPMAATSSPQGLAELLGGAQDVSVTGGQVIDGVPATEYSGTISYHAFLAVLAASERDSLNAPASLQRSGLPFKIWIDGSHHVRKLMVQLSYSGVSMTAVVNVTSVNAPVHISAPPASQVAGSTSGA